MDRKSNMKETEPVEPMFPPPRSRAYLMSGAVRLRLSVRQVMRARRRRAVALVDELLEVVAVLRAVTRLMARVMLSLGMFAARPSRRRT